MARKIVEATCIICGEKFPARDYGKENRTTQTCKKKECRSKWFSIRRKQVKRVYTVIGQRACPCGNVFDVFAQYPSKIYCCKECGSRLPKKGIRAEPVSSHVLDKYGNIHILREITSPFPLPVDPQWNPLNWQEVAA